MSKKKKSDKSEKKARVHKDLEGFEIKINPLGEITSTYSIDQLNDFLDRNVIDKKLTDKGPGRMKDEDDEFPIADSSEEDEEENEEEFMKKTRHAKEDEDDELTDDGAANPKPKKKK